MCKAHRQAGRSSKLAIERQKTASAIRQRQRERTSCDLRRDRSDIHTLVSRRRCHSDPRRRRRPSRVQASRARAERFGCASGPVLGSSHQILRVPSRFIVAQDYNGTARKCVGTASTRQKLAYCARLAATFSSSRCKSPLLPALPLHRFRPGFSSGRSVSCSA